MKVSWQGIRSEIYKEIAQYLDVGNIEPDRAKELDSLVSDHSKRIASAIWRYFKKREGDEVVVKGPAYAFNLTSTLRGRGSIFKTVRGGKRVYAGEGEVSVFDTIRKSYKSQRALLKRDLNKFFAEEGVRGIEKGASVLDLGHKSRSSIIEQRIRESKLEIATRIPPEDAERLGVTLSKRDTKDVSVIEVAIESSTLNQLKGRTTEAGLRAAYLKALEKAHRKLHSVENAAEWKGSDSRLDIEKKKIVGSFEKTAKEGPHLKKTKSDTKLDLSNTKVRKKITQRVKKSNKRPALIENLGVRRGRQKSSSTSVISLLALINSKLPETVIANMGPPSLSNRTGRFAGSARALNIVPTRQGYPSIEYTYQKDPYATFEPGGRQGSTNYDPKKLIDKSIREIAAELILGRFFTRRL